MKKTFLAIALCISPVVGFAAQAPVTQIDKFNSAATKIDDVRVATNVRLAAAQSNFTELYTLLGGNPWLAQTTAPSIHNVFWIDTVGAPPIIKYWDGDSWEVAAAGGDGTYTLPTASAETKGGVKIGARLTMTGDVLSADAQTTDISGKQDTLVSGTNIKTVNSTSLLGSGNIDISGSSVPDGTVNGQVLTWLTDQWVASTAPWLTTASLGTGVATALGFAPNTAGGFLLYSTYASDPLISWDTATITEIVDNPVAGTNKIGVKAGVFQTYDANMILWPSAISATEIGYLDGLGGALTTLLGAKLDDNQLDDTKGNGDTGYIWSADKVFDQLALKRSIADERKEIGWVIKDSDVVTAVADGKQAAVIPASMNGMVLVDFTCSVSNLNSAASGNTTVVLRRVRGATAVDMTSTGVTIAYTDYTASDEVVDTTNDDVATGDKIFVDVNDVTSPVQKGLGCTAVFANP